ncbi:MAG: ABC transporter substrate-binding protein [Thiohalocapsa sp.]
MGDRSRLRRQRVVLPIAIAALLGVVLLCVAAGLPAAAQPGEAPAVSDGVVRIGLILDMSGPYSDTTGAASATAAKMAGEDFGGHVLGAPIEVLVADHHNSSDRAAAIARDWFTNRHVDAIMDVSGSSEALIVQAIGGARHKIVVLNGPGAERLTNEACTPTSIHYAYDTYSISHAVAAALVARGDDSWFFITVDYSFGYDFENDMAAVVESSGGKVLGRARYPLDSRDFQPYLARARDSNAKVIGLANAGEDLADTLRQAAQLGRIPGPQIFASPALRINGVHALGVETAQGLMLSESFYWDLNDATRAWSKRFFARADKMPNSLQAGVYSSTMHYLKAVAAAGTDDTAPVMRAMRATPINDFFAHNGHIRADGVMVHDMHLFQVKTPAESNYQWDYYKALATIPGDQAFRPLSQSKCPLVARRG